MAMTFFWLLIFAVNSAFAEYIVCASGTGIDCSCDSAFSDEKCIMDCTTVGSCSGDVNCRAGDDCEILCTSHGSCQNIGVFADEAADVTLDCTGTGACITGSVTAVLHCGTGDCKMECGTGSCQLSVAPGFASSWQCSPSTNCDNMHTVIPPYISPTGHPSPSPTLPSTPEEIQCNGACSCPSTPIGTACLLKFSDLFFDDHVKEKHVHCIYDDAYL